MSDMFRDPACRCPDAGDLIRAELSGTEVALCSVHQGAEIAARAAQAKRDEADEYQARVTVALDEIRAPAPAGPDPFACSCPPVADMLRATLGGAQPACPVHNAPQPATSAINLGDDAALVSSIGMRLDNPSHDQPLDAA